jgi:hypothetical protein
MSPYLRALIIILIKWFGDCVQNFGEEICWKTFILKTGKGWEDTLGQTLGR